MQSVLAMRPEKTIVRTNSAADPEEHLRRASTVADRDRAREGDEVRGVDVVLRNERLLQVHNLVKTNVRVERGLDGVKEDDRAVRTTTAELALGLKSGGDGYAVVEDAIVKENIRT